MTFLIESLHNKIKIISKNVVLTRDHSFCTEKLTFFRKTNISYPLIRTFYELLNEWSLFYVTEFSIPRCMYQMVKMLFFWKTMLPVFPLQLLQTQELEPRKFWLLVLTLSPNWCKISRPYLVPVPNYWTWTKTTPQKCFFFCQILIKLRLWSFLSQKC